jgi:ssDNA thymidine ADP-ribosyltransferase, DarT
METRQAEFLVHGAVPLKLFVGVGTYNEYKAAEVRAIFQGAGVRCPVKAKSGWYY